MEAALLADFACVLHVCAATLLPLPASLPFSETWTTATPPEQATLGRLDDVYIKEQMEAGMRWTKQSGFNNNQTRDFEMLLDLIKPIMIKQGDIQGAHEIAQGSFGTIYRATYNTRPVAVKRINKDRSKSLAIKMREAYLAPLNILQVMYLKRLRSVPPPDAGCSNQLSPSESGYNPGDEEIRRLLKRNENHGRSLYLSAVEDTVTITMKGIAAGMQNTG